MNFTVSFFCVWVIGVFWLFFGCCCFLVLGFFWLVGCCFFLNLKILKCILKFILIQVVMPTSPLLGKWSVVQQKAFLNSYWSCLGLVQFSFALLAVLWSELCGHSVSHLFWKQDKILIDYVVLNLHPGICWYQFWFP